MEDIRKFIKIIEESMDQTFDDVNEGPISKALKIGAFGVLLNLTGGVSANERDVMGTSIQAVQQMQNIPDSKRKDIIKRELIKSAQAKYRWIQRQVCIHILRQGRATVT